MKVFWFRKALLLNLLTCAGLLSLAGCGGGGGGEGDDVDSGDSSTGAASYGCVECHTDKELLLASLEADPVPEPEGEALSEGEG